MKVPWRRNYSLPQRVAKSLDKASLRYSDNIALRATINLIPTIGGSLDVIFSSRGQALAAQRLTQFIDDLRTEMRLLETRVVDKDYLESEQWVDLVMRAMEAAARTRDREKIRLYAKILKGAVSNRNLREFSPEEYLTILSEMTPLEIQVATSIYRQQSDRPQEGENELTWAQRKEWDKIPERVSVSHDDMPFILIRLERTGLIKEITGAFWGYEGGVYVVTEAFRKMMQFLGETDIS